MPRGPANGRVKEDAVGTQLKPSLSAQLAHLPVLAKIKGATLVAICDNDGVKAGALAQRLGVPDVFTDIETDLWDSRPIHCEFYIPLALSGPFGIGVAAYSG